MKNIINNSTRLLLGCLFLGLFSCSSALFAADTTAPTKPVVTDDGATTYSKTTLHAGWISSDPESGIMQYKYAIGTTPGDTNVHKWASTGLNTQVTVTGLKLITGNTYYFSVKAENNAGLWSKRGSSDGIIAIRDSVAPTGTILINQGDGYTNILKVSLSIQAQDDPNGSGVYKMHFSNDGTTWLKWEDYATAKTWKLIAADGKKTVFVEFRDNYGNVSGPFSDTIILDTTPPIAKAGTDKNGVAGSPVTFNGSKSSDENGIASYAWDFGDGSKVVKKIKASHTYQAAGTYTATLTVTDVAGNKAKDSAQANITAANNNPPVLNPIGDKTIYLRNQTNTASPQIASPSTTSLRSQLPDNAELRKNEALFVPDEIIVKFKPQTISSLRANEGSQAISDGITAKLEAQTTDYDLKAIDPVFKDVKANKGAPKLGTVKIGAALGGIYRVGISKKTVSAPNLSENERLDELLHLCRQIQQSPDVAYAEPNYILKANTVPNDPSYNAAGTWNQPYADQWGLKAIQAEQAWDISTGSPNVIVAVIDSGIDYTHPDLAANVWSNPGETQNSLDDDNNGKIDDIRGWDFTTIKYDVYGRQTGTKSEDNDVMDRAGHGSEVSGIIAACSNNAVGIAGVSWQSKIMPLKALGDTGYGNSLDIANAITYAADKGAKIINMSLGMIGTAPQVLNDAIDYAYNAGCLLVASAGNDNSDVSFSYPASNPKVIAVSALEPDGTKEDYSNWGNKIELSAPGMDILSTHSVNGGVALDSRLIVTSDNNRAIQCNAFKYSGQTLDQNWDPSSLTANIEDAGLGDQGDFLNKNFNGKIALIQRGGEIPFRNKIANAKTSGAVGIIIYNNLPGMFFLSTESNPKEPIPVINISQADGLYLKNLLSLGIVTVNVNVFDSGVYSRDAGTSLASAYVSGVAALISANSPQFDNQTLRMVLRSSADDILNPGFDIYSGYGRINAFKALQINKIALAKISSPVSETSLPQTGTVDIIGSALGGDFQSYRVEYASIEYPSGNVSSNWTTITNSTSTVNNGILANWDTSSLPRGDYLLRLTVKETSRDVIDQIVLRKPVPNLAGWPVTVGAEVISSPAVGDLDGDGKLEVVVGCSDKKLYAFYNDGSNVTGFPVTLDSAIEGSPSITDIDSDGDLEIVVQSLAKIYVFNNDGSIVSGWPIYVSSPSASKTPAIGDFDNDGNMEIVCSSYPNAYVSAFHHNGTWVTGWPIGTTTTRYSSPVLTDMDNDGNKETIIGSTGIYAFEADGTWKAGFPIQTTSVFQASPAIGDIDGDGKVEIIASSYNDNKIYAFHNDGTIVNGWPVSVTTSLMSSSAIGDLDGDGKMEIVIGSFDGSVYAFHNDGTLVQGFPVQTGVRIESSPSLGDIDGEGTIEIVVGSYGGNVCALRNNGKIVPGWPIKLGGTGTYSSAAIADIDGDGQMEIIIGSQEGKVYAFKQPASSAFAPYSKEWPKFRYNLANTGFYLRKDLQFTISATDADGSSLTFSAANLPAGAAFDPPSATFSWTPLPTQTGSYPNVHFEVTDSKFTDSEDITITVK